MDNEIFSIHNSHLGGKLASEDPHLKRLSQQKYQFYSSLLDEFPKTIPGIYSLSGGRQVGKTTLLKQWMLQLTQNAPPQNIYFLTGELIPDHTALIAWVKEFLASIPKPASLSFLIIDEITYIKDWDMGLKYLADAGYLENLVLMISGSDLEWIKDARMRFPGRRGMAENVDFHLFPLNFAELTQLKFGKKNPTLDDLYLLLQNYLLHGGFMSAINEFQKQGRISSATLNTYSDWVRGDMLKRGKQEAYLREIVIGISKRMGTPITWNNIAKDLSIDHPKTVADYVHHLQAMDVLYEQQALIEDKLVAAPKTARKVIFTDPFIFHALQHWLEPSADFFETKMRTLVQNSVSASQLIEGLAVSLLRRYLPTYYIKAEGEVDVAVVIGRKFWPIEIKWTEQIRSKDLKQIAKYKNAQIWAHTQSSHQLMEKIPTIPLPQILLSLSSKRQTEEAIQSGFRIDV